MNNIVKYALLVCCALFFWGKTDKAMATCSLTSSQASVSVNQNYTFSSNSSGTSSNETPKSVTFWSGNAGETYSCPAPTSYLGICGTDAQYIGGSTSSVLAPGITGGAYASDGNLTTLDYGGCFAVGNTGGTWPAKGTMEGALQPWKYAGAKLYISDSTQARNITLNNVLVGTIFLTTSNYDGKKIGGAPLTKVYLSGTVSIPASCQLASSSVVVLPNTYAGEYSKAGTGGKVGTGTTQPMTIKCLGGSQSATIDLHVTTNKVSGDDIVTTNPDVGVRILDGSGNTVSANSGKVSATLNNGQVDVPFTYVPTAITGNPPTPGEYTAIETIAVTIP
ncbi:TPA: fimbrial protein [Enterobacter hormaechei]|uniref:fimbrial protein n=1 Tax=Enterobacter hormaechei TaxID=158836 RepID=UPI00288BBC25|nr:fimbrial protein [Enterobacter hormaechei]WNJ34241.1 fimbrial protein [Enterobacter hormaechei subsp. hormaechei]HDR1956303.1 fimbrial protein [Enterobacter hormaechei]